MDLLKELMAVKDEDFQKFHSKLCPGTEHILGVRAPEMRKLAQKVIKGDWQAFLEEAPGKYYEELVLRALVIATAPMSIEKRLAYTTDFVPFIDNWAVCDAFCSRFKDAKKYQQTVYTYLQPYLGSDKEFYLRFGIVMLLCYFINEEYIDRTLTHLRTLQHEGYYVKMAVAWALSFCYIKFPLKTEPLLVKGILDETTRKKTIGKCCESFRISKEDKEKLRKMR